MKILAHIIRGQMLCSELMSTPNQSEAYLPLIANEAMLNVLIADDNELCRNAVVRLMEKFTLRITACENGVQALETYKKSAEPFKLILLDYQMPQMNGLELIASIREIESTSIITQHAQIICN